MPDKEWNYEGFWKIRESDPDDKVLKWTWPIAEEKEWEGKSQFLETLKKVEKVAYKEHYRGFSFCRLCRKVNGTFSYEYKDWTWPEGYFHYLGVHNVRPTEKFVKFIEKCAVDVGE